MTTVTNRRAVPLTRSPGRSGDGAEVLDEHDKLVSISGGFSLDPDGVLRGQNLLALGTGRRFSSPRGLMGEFYTAVYVRADALRRGLINNDRFLTSGKVK